MLSLRVHQALTFNRTLVDVEFDPEDGLETFFYQLMSITGGDMDVADLLMIDDFGREIDSVQDILDITYSRVSSSSEEGGRPDGQSAATVWCYIRNQLKLGRYCSSAIPDVPAGAPGYAADLAGAIQPVFSVVDMPFQLCARCASFLDPSLLIAGAANAPGLLQCFQCDIAKLVEFGIAPPDAEETLRTETATIQALFGERNPAPITLYLRRRMLEDALAQIQPYAAKIQNTRECQQLRSRVESTARSVLVYEDPQQQEVARQHIDYAKVYQYAQEHLGQTATPAGTSLDRDAAEKEVQWLEEAALLVGLMRWFKLDFFRWCNKPRCEDPACDAPPHKMDAQGAGEPTPEEKNIGWAGRTEVYKCQDCGRMTRFARFNNPSHLMLTRRGRCGEFANAFCLILRALHLDARYVLDFTDHVWCEVWMPSLQRFVHCDPCERALDTPLMYESGWNKKLTHVFSFSRYGVVDASARYSRKQSTVIMRRTMEIVNECVVAEVIATKDREMETAFAMRRASASAEGLPWDLTSDHDTTGGAAAEGRSPTTALQVLAGGRAAVQALCGRDASWEQVQQRKRLQQRELLALRLSTDLTNSALCTQGRISGDQEWKLARGEIAPALPAPVLGNNTDGVAKAASAASIVPVLPAWMSSMPEGSTLSLPAGSTLLFATSGSPLCEQVLGVRGEQQAKKSLCHGWSSRLLPSANGEALLLVSGAAAPMKLSNSAVERAVLPYTAESKAAASWFAGVRRSKNGLLEENAWPEYVAVALPLQRDSSGSSLSNPVSTHTVEGHCCSEPCEVFFPEGADKSLSQAEAIATVKCLENPQLFGYTLVFTNSNPASGEVAYVLYFSGAGYPLVPMAGAKTFVKVQEGQPGLPRAPPALCVESGCLSEALEVPLARSESAAAQAKAPVSTDSADNACAVDMCYFFLGGGSHGDTSAFDSSAFLRDFPDASALQLRKLVLCAGDSLVNGVQCCFESSADAAPVASPACTSDHDRPVRRELVLEAGDRVVSVQCRSGALVDSLEVVTAAGKVLRVGGNGGGDTCKVEIPSGMELCGFFGGTGGHLHNLGVVLRSRASAAEVSTPCSPPARVAASQPSAAVRRLRARLLALCEEKQMSTCGLLTFYCGQSASTLFRENQTGRFVDLLCELRAENTLAAAGACVRTIATYLRNILKNPLEKKYQTVKLSNAVLRQQVLACQGGLPLLCFGPGAFSLCSEGGALVLRSGIASDILEADRSAGFRRQYESWLQLYVTALEAAMVQFSVFDEST